MSSTEIICAKSRGRSRLGNGSIPAGVDGRGAEWRRYKELLAAYSEEFGAPVTESQLNELNRLVWLIIAGEKHHAAIAAGEVVDDDALIRNANAVSRALAALRNRRKSTAMQNGPDTLRSYLTAKAGQA